MAVIYGIIISPKASRQLREIFNFISRSSSQNAMAVSARLLDAINSLTEFPHRYRIARYRGAWRQKVRSIRPYLIRYRVGDRAQTVRVLSIRHGARKPGL